MDILGQGSGILIQ